jgi:hypothetical protein
MKALDIKVGNIYKVNGMVDRYFKVTNIIKPNTRLDVRCCLTHYLIEGKLGELDKIDSGFDCRLRLNDLAAINE